METAHQYRQKIEARMSSIKDSNMQRIINDLLNYAERIEGQLNGLQRPVHPPVGYSHRGIDSESTAQFEAQIDLNFLPDEESDNEPSPRELVRSLLTFTASLESQKVEG